MKSEVDFLANFPIDTSLKKKTHSAMTNHILPHSARTAPIDNTRAGINDSIVRGVHTSTMEFLLGFFTLLCIFAAHIFMLGILRI